MSVAPVNGGWLGYKNVWAEWGDNAYASLFGSTAKVEGDMTLSDLAVYMQESPEPAPTAMAPGTGDKPSCYAQCREYQLSCALPWPKCACYQQCDKTGSPESQQKGAGGGSWITNILRDVSLAAIGVVVVGVGAYALVKD